MAKEVKAKFRKKDGKFIMIGRKLWEMEMNKLFPDNDVEIVGIFRKPVKQRTTKQNGFYFGVFVYSQIDCFLERWGEIMDVKQVHDWNKSNVWCKEKIVGDEVVKIPASSTENDTIDWENRLEKCRQYFILNFDWALPIPNTQTEIDY